ncbi:hypothetical protein EB796_012323 [Bugula neritina]|uniref:Uncharacterized protein n=1 Tax=Bugula neritina TaxID=10212 RepID=A0A7J7JSN6_BUGNE|nr:hypothetical protein EB796_012323 [Bugula neritina]
MKPRLDSLERNSRIILLPTEPIRDGAIVIPIHKPPEDVTDRNTEENDEPQQPGDANRRSPELVRQWIDGMTEYLRRNSRWWTYCPTRSAILHSYEMWQNLVHFLAFDSAENLEGRDG